MIKNSASSMFVEFTYLLKTNVAMSTIALVRARRSAMERVIAGRHSKKQKKGHQL